MNRMNTHARNRISARRSAPNAAMVVPVRRCAFTLIELAVVMTILTIMATTAVMRIDGMAGASRMRAAIDRLAALDQQARVEAIGRGQPRRIVLPIGTETIFLERPEQVGSRWHWRRDAPTWLGRGIYVDAIVRESETPFGEGEPAVRFHVDGTSPSYVALLRNRADTLAAARLQGLSGRYETVLDVPEEAAANPALLFEVER